jgi:large subunit ribosomal protein L15
MDLTEVSQGVHKRKLKKRVGRGPGSGHGKTASRGHKGQYASAGANLPGALFTGGQTPIHRIFPKRGFSNARFAKEFAEVNVGDLEKLPNRSKVDLGVLKAAGIINGTWDGLRVLGNGELTKTLYVTADHVTAGAKKKIEFTGGTFEALPGVKAPVRNKMGQGKRTEKKRAKQAAEKAKPAQ